MAARFHSHACILHCFQRLYIDTGRCQKCLAKRGSQLLIVGLQSLFVEFLLKYLADQGETITVNAGGCHTDQYITRFQVFAGNHVFFINHTDSKTSQIIIFLRHQSRMLSCLAADQCSLRLQAALCNTLYDIRDLLRIVLAAGNIVQEKQRLAACTCNVVDTHRNRVDTDRVMLVHDDRQFYLGTTAVRTR